MANNVLTFDFKSVTTHYGLLFHLDGTVRDVVAGTWETYATADLDDYDVVLTKLANNEIQQFTFPSGISAGTYLLWTKRRVGASPAESDDRVGGAVVDWDGTNIVGLAGDYLDTVTASILDSDAAVDGKTLREALQYIAAVLAGKVSGAGSGTETFKGLDGSTDRVKSTVTEIGNRTAVELDP